jgi:hypothetical protein
MKQKPPPSKQKIPPSNKKVGILLGTFGATISLSILGGIWIGQLADEHFHSGYLCTLIGLLFGLIVGIGLAYYLLVLAQVI